MKLTRFALLALILIPAALAAAADKDAHWLTTETLAGLELRGIGPAVSSGRVSDIAVDPTDHSRYFVTVASGGVWRTTNAGTTWEPVFDGEGSYSIGCVTIDPNDPNVVWVGTGENNSQRSISFGDGVYKSLDGGSTWKNMGLGESEHIGNIVVDPARFQRRLGLGPGPAVAVGWRSRALSHHRRRRDLGAGAPHL